jgi:adenylate cyclase
MKDIVEAIFASTPDAIVTADSGGRIISWNPAAERIFGYGKDDVLGHPLTVLIPERFRAAHDAGLSRVARGGETRIVGQAVKVTGVRRDGSEFPLELSLATWVSDGDRFFSGIIRDVSDREQILEDLAQSEKRLRAIMSSTQDGIVCVDEQGEVVLWNPGAEKMFGRAEADMVGKPLTQIIPERHRDAHNAGIRRLRESGEARVIGKPVELAALHGDGSEFPIELSLGTWTVGDKRYFSGIIRDISRRKQAEQEVLLANRALDEKNQQLEALSAKLAKYLSKQVYDSIFSGRTDVRVNSYRKKLTMFFSDVQGFTEITDAMEAEALADLLNRYLSEMSAIAHQHGGTIDKFIGDGIMIFFGDPESRGEKEDALACIRMALAMRRRMSELQEEWLDQGLSRPLHVRMGINTGFCTVGNFGSENRLDYTIVGGEVNATARLETAARPGQILISHSTYALVSDDVHCRPVGEIALKGIPQALKVYEVVGSLDGLADEATLISETCDGFRLKLDAAALSLADRARATEALLRALDALSESPNSPKCIQLASTVPVCPPV